MEDVANTSRAIVRVEYLLATEPFQSNEETRYYLNGLSIEPHPRAGALIVATDGHLLSCIHNEDAIVIGEPTIWGVPWKTMLANPIKAFRKKMLTNDGRQIFADLQRSVGKPDRLRLVAAFNAKEVFQGRGEGDNLDPTIFFTHFGDKEVGRIWIDGTFPEWRRVVPDYATAENFMPSFFQAKYIAKVAAFGMALSGAADGSSGCCMTIFSNNGGDPAGREGCPAIARFSQSCGFVVMMPMRDAYTTLADIKENGGKPAWLKDQGDPAPEVCDTPDLKVAA